MFLALKFSGLAVWNLIFCNFTFRRAFVWDVA